jgi:hypothetical protein
MSGTQEWLSFYFKSPMRSPWRWRVPATWRTARDVRAPRGASSSSCCRGARPSVIAIDELRARMAGLQHLGVVVDTGDRRRTSTPASACSTTSPRGSAPTRPEWCAPPARGTPRSGTSSKTTRPLYMDLADLETVRTRIEARRDWEASKEQGALLDEDEPPPPLDFDDIQQKYDRTHRQLPPLRGRPFRQPRAARGAPAHRGTASSTPAVSGEALLGRVKSDVAALHPESYAPGCGSGSPATSPSTPRRRRRSWPISCSRAWWSSCS